MLNSCFVGLFDIIAFKALREKMGTAGLMRIFERSALPLIQFSAAGQLKDETRNGRIVSVPNFNDSSIGYRVFSDTVIFWTRDDSLQSFLQIINSSAQLTASGFGSHVPYRGAIGHGDFLVRGEIIVGKALEDAYSWEAKQAWAGVSLSPDCAKFCEENNHLNQREQVLIDAAKNESDKVVKNKILRELDRLVPYPIPIQLNPKDGPVTYSICEGIALNWTLNVYEGAAEKSLDKTHVDHSRHIREQTISFENWARKFNTPPQ